jgi:hypothetical protein
MGDVRATVHGLDQFNGRIRVTVFADPQTTEEFERIVQACGGPGRFQTDRAFAWADIPGGQVIVNWPLDAPKWKPTNPFAEQFEARARAARAPGRESLSDEELAKQMVKYRQK